MFWVSNYHQDNNPLLKHLAAEVVDINDPVQAKQHRVTKRQMMTDESAPTPENIALCTSQIYDAVCSAGLLSAIIEIDLSCNTYSRGFGSIERNPNACARNEDGQYCQSAFALFDLNGIGQNYIEGNCSGALASNSCPLGCRTILEDFRNRLGCCINLYVNGSGELLTSVSVDYRLWNLCNVPLVPTDCGNGPIIDSPDIVRYCSEKEYFNKQYTQNICSERGRPYINVIKNLDANIPSAIERIFVQ